VKLNNSLKEKKMDDEVMYEQAVTLLKLAFSDLKRIMPFHDGDGERKDNGWNTLQEINQFLADLEWREPEKI
jgi:hypothetical protein